MRALILTAGSGSRFGGTGPKSLIRFAGRSLLDWQLDRLWAVADAVGLVVGYRSELFADMTLPQFVNAEYERTQMVSSLMAAGHWLDGHTDLLVAYGDIWYARAVVEQLVYARGTSVRIPVNHMWKPLWDARFTDPFEDAETLKLSADGRVVEIGRRPRFADEIAAQYMGLVYLPAATHDTIGATWEALGRPARLSMTELLNRLASTGTAVETLGVDGGWLEIDSRDDLALYERQHRAGTLHELIGADAADEVAREAANEIRERSIGRSAAEPQANQPRRHDR